MRRLLLLFAALLVVAPSAWATTPSFDSASNAGSANASSLTFSHTTSGTNRDLVCGVSTQNPTKTVTSVTFNGVALSQLSVLDNTDDPTRQSRVEVWYLVNPPATTANVVVTLNAATAVSAGCLSYSDVNQMTPHGTPAAAKGDSTVATVNVGSASGEIVIDVASIRVGTTTITAGTGQTERVEKQSAAGAGNTTIGMSSKAGAATVTMSWTVDENPPGTPATAKAWTTIGISIKGITSGGGGGGGGSTITVCAAGCSFDNAHLQAALDSAVDGDAVLVESAHTYVAPSSGYVLGKRCASPTWDCVTFRTGVTSSGAIMSTALFPASNVRPTVANALLFAKILPSVNNEGALRTVYPGETGPSCDVMPCTGSGWSVQWIEFGPKIDWAQRALVRFGTNKAGKEFQGGVWVDTLPGGETQDTLAEVPQYLSLLQCYIHGGAFIGQHQGITLSSKDARILNNVIDDIKSLVETQAITGINGIGPYDVENNQLSATMENILWGGADTYLRLAATVSGSPTTTSVQLSSPVWEHLDGTTQAASLATDIYSGIFISITHAGTEYGGVTCTFSGSTCTLSPALPFTPSVGDTVRWCWLMGGLTLRYNDLLKKPEWFDPILSPPTVLTPVAGTGGSLSAGEHCYKVSVRAFVSGATPDVNSAASSEQCVTTVASGKATITWNADPNAETYRVYGNGAVGTENQFWDVAAPTVTYIDTGAAGTAGTPPSSGTIWPVKNNGELKQGDGASPMGPILIEYNVFDYGWCCSQNNIISFKVNNQNTSDVSVTIRNLTFRGNWIRHGNRAIALTCTTTGNASPQSPSGPMTDVSITNNVWSDMSSAWVNTSGTVNNSAIFVTTGSYANEVPARGCVRVSFTHNTFLYDTNDMNGPIWFNLNTSADQMVDFVLRDNIMARECTTASCTSNATKSLKAFNPSNAGQGTTAWNVAVTGASIADHNAWPDGSVGTYTAGPFTNSFFPTDAALKATHLVDYANCKTGTALTGCALLNTSSLHHAGSDGLDIGADISAMAAGIAIALSGDAGEQPATPRLRFRLRIHGTLF